MALTPTLDQETTQIKLGLKPQGTWTYEDWLNFPDDGWKYEIIDGVLYMSPPPATGHQRSSSKLLTRMNSYAETKNLGEIIAAPCGVRLPNQSVPVEPDIFFIKKARLHIIQEKYVEGVPDLIVEILSPSNPNHDRETKFRIYQEAGVPEYWLVDYLQKTVEVFVLTEGVYTLHNNYRAGDTITSAQLTGFEIAVNIIFNF